MKKIILFLIIFALLFSLSACGQNQEEEAAASSTGDAGQTEEKEGAVPEDEPLQDEEGETEMKIRVEADGNTILFALNDSQAAQDLYDQLPLQIEVENYSSNEKIFYPPEELDVSDAPQAGGGVGTLAYYRPADCMDWAKLFQGRNIFPAYPELLRWKRKNDPAPRTKCIKKGKEISSLRRGGTGL